MDWSQIEKDVRSQTGSILKNSYIVATPALAPGISVSRFGHNQKYNTIQQNISSIQTNQQNQQVSHELLNVINELRSTIGKQNDEILILERNAESSAHLLHDISEQHNSLFDRIETLDESVVDIKTISKVCITPYN